jgi:hypothetical protein
MIWVNKAVFDPAEVPEIFPVFKDCLPSGKSHQMKRIHPMTTTTLIG